MLAIPRGCRICIMNSRFEILVVPYEITYINYNIINVLPSCLKCCFKKANTFDYRVNFGLTGMNVEKVEKNQLIKKRPVLPYCTEVL